MEIQQVLYFWIYLKESYHIKSLIVKKQMQAIEERWNKNGCSYDITNPAKKIRNAKTGFEPRMIREEANHREVVFSYYMRKINHFLKKIYCQIPQKL